MADMTATTMATWLPRVYSRTATITLRAKTVNVPLLDHTWEPEIRGPGKGDRVLIPGFSQNNAPRNRGAGTGTFGTGATITYDATTEAQTTLQIDRWYYKAHRQPFELIAQQMANYPTLLARGQGEAIQLQIDADIAADNSNGYDNAGSTVGVDNQDITEDDLFTVQTNLNNQNAPVEERSLVVSPASHASLLKVEALRNSLTASSIGNLDGSKGAGWVGKVLTFNVYMSNNLEAGTAGKKNCGFHKQFIAYADQVDLTPELHRDLTDGGFSEMMTWQTCGFKIIKSAFGNELDGK